MRYITNSFSIYRLPSEALIEVKSLSFTDAARWAHTEPVQNWIYPTSNVADLSRSFAPIADNRENELHMKEGDEALIIAPASRRRPPKSVNDLRYTWVRVREISREAA